MWAVELRFDPARTDRMALRAAHRESLADAHAKGQVAMAGPFADERGALLLFTLATREEVEALMADDPYYRAPGVEVTAVREWKPLFGA